MAKAQVREWNDASGNRHTEILYADGSYERWTNGDLADRRDADEGRARAYAARNYDAAAEAAAQGEAFENSPYGRRLRAQEEAAGRRTRQVEDRDYGLRRDDLGLRRDDSRTRNRLDEKRFGLDERRLGMDQVELDRRFGLDSARMGIDYFQTANEYGKNPRSWLASLEFENPAFMRQFTSGLANPAFGGKGATNPGMKSITESVAGVNGGGAATGGTMGANGSTFVDPAKNIQAILKGSPPSAGSNYTPQDIAAVQLIAKMYENGGRNMAEGSLESMDPDELGFAQGVMDYISPNGGDRFVRNYGRTRIPGRGAANPFSAV